MLDNNVLSKICSLIDDPKTFRNFALVNKKFHYISSLHKYDKMLQFCKIETRRFDGIEFTLRFLPNGKEHGLISHISKNLIQYNIYYNGYSCGMMCKRPESNRYNLFYYAHNWKGKKCKRFIFKCVYDLLEGYYLESETFTPDDGETLQKWVLCE